MRRIILIATLFTVVTTAVKSQKTWSLQDCVNHALEHNIQVKQFLLNVNLAETNLKQSQLNTFPTLNSMVSHGWNWGQAIDRFTNQFATERVRSNNFYGQSALTLFNGFQKLNTIIQNRYELMASQYDADQYMDDITLSIATGYLQILYAKELLGIARNQLDITRQQVDRMQKLVTAGTLARGDLLLLEAQMATEELRYVEARNNLDISYLTLRQMLDLPADVPFEIQQPEIEFYESRTMFMSPDQIYHFAKNQHPAIRSADIRIESAIKGLAIARGSQSPQLQMTATWGTGFSGAQKIGTDPFTEEIQIGYDSDMRPVYTLRPMFRSFEVKPFEEQFRDNDNRTIDFRLTVPIFNGWFTRASINRAKIAVRNAELESESVQLQFNKTIQQAWADAAASLKRYKASVKMVEATIESFQYAEQKFNVGVMNSLDYNNAKNELQRAQSELLQARYDYLFKTKVLDFYMGTPIVL